MPQISDSGLAPGSFSLQNADDADRGSADQMDQASATEALFLRQALAERERQKWAVPQEAPDEDAEGNRYCLDCGDVIPVQRIHIMPNAVRCVACLSVKERLARQARQHGGINDAEC